MKKNRISKKKEWGTRGRENKMTVLRITKEVGQIWRDMVKEKKGGLGGLEDEN